MSWSCAGVSCILDAVVLREGATVYNGSNLIVGMVHNIADSVQNSGNNGSQEWTSPVDLWERKHVSKY